MRPGHRSSSLWSPPYSSAQGSSRGGETSVNVVGESDSRTNQEAADSCVCRAPPTPSHWSRAHCGRWISRPRAPPFCHTHSLSYKHTQSLSLSPFFFFFTRTLWGPVKPGDHVSSHASQYYLSTSHSPQSWTPGATDSPAARFHHPSLCQHITLLHFVWNRGGTFLQTRDLLQTTFWERVLY